MTCYCKCGRIEWLFAYTKTSREDFHPQHQSIYTRKQSIHLISRRAPIRNIKLEIPSLCGSGDIILRDLKVNGEIASSSRLTARAGVWSLIEGSRACTAQTSSSSGSIQQPIRFHDAGFPVPSRAGMRGVCSVDFLAISTSW